MQFRWQTQTSARIAVKRGYSCRQPPPAPPHEGAGAHVPGWRRSCETWSAQSWHPPPEPAARRQSEHKLPRAGDGGGAARTGRACSRRRARTHGAHAGQGSARHCPPARSGCHCEVTAAQRRRRRHWAAGRDREVDRRHGAGHRFDALHDVRHGAAQSPAGTSTAGSAQLRGRVDRCASRRAVRGVLSGLATPPACPTSPSPGIKWRSPRTCDSGVGAGPR